MMERQTSRKIALTPVANATPPLPFWERGLGGEGRSFLFSLLHHWLSQISLCSFRTAPSVGLRHIFHPSSFIFLVILAFAIFFSALSIQQHRAFLTNGLDIGNVDQALWNTAQGRFLHFTLMAPVESRLALHVEPILLVFVPFYRLGLGGPELLLITQATIVALGAWPLFQIAKLNFQPLVSSSRHRTPNSPPSPRSPAPLLPCYLITLAYLLLPTLQSAVLFDFHAVTMASTFLLFAFLALEQKHNGRFLIFALLVMACKEDMPLVVAMLGLYVGLAQRRWRLASGTIALSLVWFSLAFFVIQPRFAAGGNIQLDRYAWLGDTPVEMAATLLTQPRLVLGHLWGRVDLLHYLGSLFFPTAFLALFSPLTLIPMLPTLAVNLLSDNPFTWRLEDFHYGAPLAPFLFISAIHGIRRLSLWVSRGAGEQGSRGAGERRSRGAEEQGSGGAEEQGSRGAGEQRSRGAKEQGSEGAKILDSKLPSPPAPTLPCPPAPLLVYALSILLFTFSAIYHYHRGYTPLARPFDWPEVTAHHHRLDQVLSTIPADAPLFAQSNLAPHLSQRQTIYGDFGYFTDPDFPASQPVTDVVLDVSTLENIGGLHQFLKQTLVSDPRYRLVTAQDGILYYQLVRRNEQLPNVEAQLENVDFPPAFYTFTQPDSALDYSVQIDFSDVIRLHGYALHFDRQEEVEVTVDLEPLRPLAEVRPVLYLLDAAGQPVGATADLPPALVWYPVEQWPVGERVRVRFNTLPWYTRETQSYRLALGVVSGPEVWNVSRRHPPANIQATEFAPRLPGDGTLLELAHIEQTWSIAAGGPRLRQFGQPGLPHRTQANFGNQLRLLGHSTPTPLHPQAETLSITLYWQAVAAPEKLVRFVQLVGPDGLVYGQRDSAPDNGQYPTHLWQPGEVVIETVTLPLQPERPPGTYTLHLGLYRPETGQRLALDNGRDHLEIDAP